jgi:autotransporter-associated beta strand protein
VISGAGSLNVIGTVPYAGTNGTLILSGASSFTGNVIISNAWVSDTVVENVATPGVGGLGNPQTAGRTITINNNGVLSLDSAGGNEFGTGSSAPVLGIVVNQGGIMQITSGNATVGPLTFNGGTLITTSSTFGAEYAAIELGSTVTIGGTSPTLFTNVLNTLDSGLNLGVNATTGQTTFNVGSTGSANPDLAVWVPLIDGGGVAIGSSSRGLIKTGTGTLALFQTNTYHGATTLSNGVVVLDSTEQVGVSGPLGTSAAANAGSIVFNGGTLRYSAVNNNDYSGRFSTATNQPFNIDTAGQSVSFATALAGTNSSLTKLGTGTLTLSATNTFTGAATVSNGSLVLTTTGAISNSTALNIAAGGTLNVSSKTTFT